MARVKLVTKNQVLKSLHIKHLRGVNDFDINFEGNPVTGIFGLNGSGKTTILQTILCLYRDKGNENTKMSRFFKYTSAANKWIGSEYSAVMDYINLSLKRPKAEHDKPVEYKKPRSEWSPRQAKKPDRNVIYISLSDSVPDIERVSEKKVTFNPIAGAILDAQITTAASQVLNVNYENLVVSKLDKIDCFTVRRNGIECHSLNLGAGEQKVFRILQRLYRAPAYSLFIIDEIDLTLHTAALKELLKIIVFEARKEDRKLQVVFTSHRQELMVQPLFNVRFILNTPTKTFCLENPTEDCYEQLSGSPIQYLKIYIEDDLARAIAKRAGTECGMSTHIQYCRFGSVTNSVRLALGLACQHDDLSIFDDIVFFGDGDVEEFTKEAKIKSQIDATLAGHDPYLEARRDKVKNIIKHFIPQLPDGRMVAPEVYIHEALIMADENNNPCPEAVIQSKAIVAVVDTHDYVDKLIEQGLTYENVVMAFAATPQWAPFVRDLKGWINERKNAHRMPVNP